jgi:hypothetical protein
MIYCMEMDIIQPMQSHRWRAQVPAHTHSVEERTIIKDHKKLKTENEERPSETPEELLNEWECRNAVSATIVTVELLQRSPLLLHFLCSDPQGYDPSISYHD